MRTNPKIKFLPRSLIKDIVADIYVQRWEQDLPLEGINEEMVFKRFYARARYAWKKIIAEARRIGLKIPDYAPTIFFCETIPKEFRRPRCLGLQTGSNIYIKLNVDYDFENETLYHELWHYIQYVNREGYYPQYNAYSFDANAKRFIERDANLIARKLTKRKHTRHKK